MHTVYKESGFSLLVYYLVDAYIGNLFIGLKMANRNSIGMFKLNLPHLFVIVCHRCVENYKYVSKEFLCMRFI